MKHEGSWKSRWPVTLVAWMREMGHELPFPSFSGVELEFGKRGNVGKAAHLGHEARDAILTDFPRVFFCISSFFQHASLESDRIRRMFNQWLFTL